MPDKNNAAFAGRGGLSLCGNGAGGGKRVPRIQMIWVNNPKGNADSA